MADTKHPLGRYLIIDRELSRKQWVKTKELKKIIEEELSISVSERTINEDIIAMREDPLLGFDAPIEKDKKNKAYYYSDPNYTIKAFKLREADINALLFYAKTLSLYKEYDVFKDFTNAIDKVLEAVKIRKNIKEASRSRSIIQTEKGHSSKGNEYISGLIQALEENKVIEVSYKKFGSEVVKKRKLQPYFLKEDKFRWYLLAKPVDKDQLRVYGLDRIEGIIFTEEEFMPSYFDPDEYFKYSFGVTVPEVEPIEVIISMNSYQGNFIKTLPIHETQTVLIDNENEFRILVIVKPSFEFYSKISSYIDCIKILSPESVILELKSRLSKTLNLYK
jgi:predicted DNA-binding transcriptional regulator YafY